MPRSLYFFQSRFQSTIRNINHLKNTSSFSTRPYPSEEKFIQLIFGFASCVSLAGAIIFVDAQVSCYKKYKHMQITAAQHDLEWDNEHQQRRNEFKTQKDAFEKSLQNECTNETRASVIVSARTDEPRP